MGKAYNENVCDGCGKVVRRSSGDSTDPPEGWAVWKLEFRKSFEGRSLWGERLIHELCPDCALSARSQMNESWAR